ncbi:MAG: hypothetical protein MJE68_02080 [Proteobacteria bacterium]|nr:hypothetical protein [Pseudomonadota bacterium]
MVQVGARWATLQWLPPDNVGPLPPLSLYKIVATPHLAMYYNNDDDDVTEQSNSDDSIPTSTNKKGTPTPEGHKKIFSDDHSSGFTNRSLVQGVDPNTTCVEVNCDRLTMTADASLTVVNVTGLVPALGYEVVVHALSNGTNLISRPSRAVSITTQHSGQL